MLLLISMSLMFMLLMNSSSPLKMSLFLTVISTMMSMIMHFKFNSVFTPCCVIISFSSGMMILFSYCSISCVHENKNNTKKSTFSLMLIFSAIMIMAIPQEEFFSSLEKTMLTTNLTLMLMFMMSMIILCMKCMNISLFNPSKKLMQTYLWL